LALKERNGIEKVSIKGFGVFWGKTPFLWKIINLYNQYIFRGKRGLSIYSQHYSSYLRGR
jgi:hypothetical protein